MDPSDVGIVEFFFPDGEEAALGRARVFMGVFMVFLGFLEEFSKGFVGVLFQGFSESFPRVFQEFSEGFLRVFPKVFQGFSKGFMSGFFQGFSEGFLRIS